MRYVLLIIILVVAVLSLMIYAYRQKRSAQPMEVNVLMTAYANQAVERARREYSKGLDYSPSSIEQVESILSKLYEKRLAHALSEDQLNEEVNTWGAYVGEVAKRVRPGAWQRDSKVSGKDAMPLVHDARNETYPLAWVYKRITNGPEDNVWSKFQLTYSREKFKQIDLNEPLKEAGRK